MTSPLSVLLGGVQETAQAALTIWGGVKAVQTTKETSRQAYELKAKELEYQTAQAEKAALKDAAFASSKMVTANLIKGLTTLAVVMVGGSIVYAVVKKFMRVRK